MRTLTEAHQLWVNTFTPNTNLLGLKAAVKGNGQNGPCNKGLRSMCWKAFLLFGNLDQSTWLKPLEDSRSAYGSLREHFLRDIRHADDISEADPLADDETSPWNVLRRDEIIRAEIFQDIERCMPENLYFREPTTQAMMLDILFIFCKLNADIGYRQGMHEILALVLWVVSRDAIDSESIKRVIPTEELMDDLFQVALNAAYIEHDAFTLFCIIMQNVKSFYEIGGVGSQSNSPIVERSKRIHEDYLYQVDPELAEHLTAIEVLPQIFVMSVHRRWIRLLFGREFPLEDVLCLWDALFAEDAALTLIDLICVAMLLRIRWQLLQADYSSALTLLLRYPTPEAPHGPSTFVIDARLLRQDLSQSSGERLILKYSNKVPEAPKVDQNRRIAKGLRLPKKSAHLRSSSQDSRSDSPRRSPARFLQEQGGIEGILSEAAKGVYSRGERWGVTKAFKEAVSGLQSGANTPKRVFDSSRWSLDEGKSIGDDVKRLTARVKALEERNSALAKMLNTAMEDLWNQQKQFKQNEMEMETNALNVAIAKVQFVQVYLEDSSIPLFPNSSMEEAESGVREEAEPQSVTDENGETERSSLPSSKAQGQITAGLHLSKDQLEPPTIMEPDQPPSPPSVESASNSAKSSSTDKPPSNTSQPANQFQNPTKTSNKSAATAIINEAAHLGPSPFSHPRPSLAQSSFSWILKDSSDEVETPSTEVPNRPKSSFVSASPFPPDHRPEDVKKRRTTPANARKKAGFLFGDEKNDGPLVESKREGKKGEEVVLGEDGEEGEGFGMGTLRGIRRAKRSKEEAQAD